MDLTPLVHGGKQNIVVDGIKLEFEYDKEKLFWNIRKPTKHDLTNLEWFELTAPYPEEALPRRTRHKQKPEDIPTIEWRKRLALLPEDVVNKTLENTTQFYLSVEGENREEPRRHLQSRAPGLRLPRQNELVYSDTYFPSVQSDRGNTCSQIFVGEDSDRWETYPLKTESHNGIALQDYTRQFGCPKEIKTDNAQSEIGLTWTDHCRRHCTGSQSTEPNHPQQNKAERRIQDLNRMVRKVIREFKAPLGKHDWCQKYCCDVHNVAANRSLDWRSPLELNTGHTPDISMYRFHFWEPIWYFDPSVKAPASKLKKGRWLGFAHSAGDAMTYYIQTEKDPGEGRNVILVRSVIKTRHKDIGEKEEYSNEDPQYDDFFLTDHELLQGEEDLQAEETTIEPVDGVSGEQDQQILPVLPAGPVVVPEKIPPEDNIPMVEQLPPDTANAENVNAMYDQNEMDKDEQYEFDCIVDHKFDDGILKLRVQYKGEDNEHYSDIAFDLLKKDVPFQLAKYIREKVMEPTRDGRYIRWAKGILQEHIRTIRRLQSSMQRTSDGPAKRRKSRNSRNADNSNNVLFGIRVPKNVKEAYALDAINGNKLWAEAIDKEMGALEKMECFEYHEPTYKPGPDYQYAPLRLIFTIKKEDLRHKARLVIGGHVVDASMYNSYASTVQALSLRLLLTVAAANDLDIATGDIGNAFLHADCKEKVYSRAGPEFGPREGCILIMLRALYGLVTSSRQWHEFLADSLRAMGFKPTRADPDIWYIRSPHYAGYDYMGTHIDDLIVAAKRPHDYLALIEQEFLVRNICDSPSFYLGLDFVKRGKYMQISTKTYVKEVLRRYQDKHGCLRKENIPLSPNVHPELDASELLYDDGITLYQHIIGITQWLVTAGRLDLTFAVVSLSRFSCAPRKGHLDLAKKIFGYLKKYPKLGYFINPESPRVEIQFEKVEPDFGHQYDYFVEELDPRFPEPLLNELDINIFADSDHGHDKVTGRSITGLIGMVGSTPTMWSAKRQPCVQTSTFGAEFVAMKKAVEEAITLRYHLRSFGVAVNKPTCIYADNMGVIINASNPASTLNKKPVALSYHFTREHVANSVIEIRKIDTDHNYADPFTKAINSTQFHKFFYELLRN
ncbi:MAG: reverse transcriptase domain-containing protein [Gloeomargaritales cyanobacterium]